MGFVTKFDTLYSTAKSDVDCPSGDQQNANLDNQYFPSRVTYTKADTRINRVLEIAGRTVLAYHAAVAPIDSGTHGTVR
jgi:hypothetical protein